MIGKNIKNIRERKNIGVNELSRLSGVNASYISALERGGKDNPSITTLEKIADALDVPLNYLLKKSAKSIIEQTLEKLDMTFEELSKITNISTNFFNSLDDIIPDPSDYRNMEIIGEKIGISSDELIKALYLQEPPVYDSPISTSAYDDFKLTEYSKEDKQHIETYMSLNDLGKNKVIEYTKDLLDNPKYKKEDDNKVVELPKKDDEFTKVLEARKKAEEYFKENPHLMPIASHDKEGEFTEEDYKHDDDIMTNDDLWK